METNAYLFRMTKAEAERAVREGAIGQRDYARYLAAWTWGAARFSGSAGDAQERFYAKRGGAALLERFARVVRAMRRVEEDARAMAKV